MSQTPDWAIDSRKVFDAISRNLHQRYFKYRAGKLSTHYMVKYLVKHTNLNLFEIGSLLKDFRNKEKQYYDIMVEHKIYWSGKDRFDTTSTDFDNIRKVKLKKRKEKGNA